MFKRKGVDERHVRELEKEASACVAHGQYAEAAEAYNRAAAAYLEENVLIYASYSHQAFHQWLKAGDAPRAASQANQVFQVLDDAGWLGKSMEKVIDLILMISELKAAGYPDEAQAFAEKMDHKLAEFGLMLKPASGAALPANCPSCGAALPTVFGASEVKCSFCGWSGRAA